MSAEPLPEASSGLDSLKSNEANLANAATIFGMIAADESQDVKVRKWALTAYGTTERMLAFHRRGQLKQLGLELRPPKGPKKA